MVKGAFPEGVVGAWKGDGVGRMANAPPPATCQLMARNFCTKAVRHRRGENLRQAHSVGLYEIGVPSATRGLQHSRVRAFSDRHAGYTDLDTFITILFPRLIGKGVPVLGRTHESRHGRLKGNEDDNGVERLIRIG